MEPDRVAEVGSPVVGVIESVAVERGDLVRRGQTLALLKADVERASMGVAQARAESEADVRGAQANVEFTRQKLARAEEMVRQEFIAPQALEQIVAETQIAEQRLALAREQQRIWRAERDLAQQQLSLRAIRAPFDGIIAERYISAGERIEDKPAFRIVKTDPLRVEVVVPSSLFGTVRPGMTAQVLPDLPAATKLKAKVILVDKVIDGASNTFRVRAELPNPGAALPSGLRCKAELGEQPASAADAATPARAEPRAVPARSGNGGGTGAGRADTLSGATRITAASGANDAPKLPQDAWPQRMSR
jgi:RND family efflux transporter MFP subunit